MEGHIRGDFIFDIWYCILYCIITLGCVFFPKVDVDMNVACTIILPHHLSPNFLFLFLFEGMVCGILKWGIHLRFRYFTTGSLLSRHYFFSSGSMCVVFAIIDPYLGIRFLLVFLALIFLVGYFPRNVIFDVHSPSVPSLFPQLINTYSTAHRIPKFSTNSPLALSRGAWWTGSFRFGTPRLSLIGACLFSHSYLTCIHEILIVVGALASIFFQFSQIDITPPFIWHPSIRNSAESWGIFYFIFLGDHCQFSKEILSPLYGTPFYKGVWWGGVVKWAVGSSVQGEGCGNCATVY